MIRYLASVFLLWLVGKLVPDVQTPPPFQASVHADLYPVDDLTSFSRRLPYPALGQVDILLGTALRTSRVFMAKEADWNVRH